MTNIFKAILMNFAIKPIEDIFGKNYLKGLWLQMLKIHGIGNSGIIRDNHIK
jgi:hypothetical protein